MFRTAIQAVVAAAILAALIVGPAVFFASATRLGKEPGVLTERMPCGMTRLECTDRQMLAKAQLRP